MRMYIYIYIYIYIHTHGELGQRHADGEGLSDCEREVRGALVLPYNPEQV